MKKIDAKGFINRHFELVRPNYVYYKVTPNTSIRNNTTDRLAQMVNRLYVDLNKRVYIEGKKLKIKMDSKISYYIYLEKDRAEFYFIIPREYVRIFREKIRDIWKNVEMQEVTQLPAFSTDCTKYSLQYKKEDALSLSVDKRNNELLSSNLGILDILESDNNDKIGIVYNFLPSSKSVMSQFRKYHMDVMRKFKDNQPLVKTHNSVLYVLKTIFLYVVNSFNQVLSTLQGSLISNPLDTLVPQKPLSNATKKKESAIICRSQIMILSESSNKTAQSVNGRAVAESFSAVSEDADNALTCKETKKKFDILSYSFPVPTNLTSTEECSNFISLPGRELLKEFPAIEHTKVLENPVPEELQTGFFRLGDVKAKDTVTTAYKSNDEQLSRLGITYLGSMGAGKTTFMTNNAYDAVNAGHGLVCIDIINNCELSNSIKSITPPERLVEIDCSNPNQLQAFAYNEIKITKGMSAEEKVCKATLKTQQIEVLINSINSDASQLTPKMLRFLYASGNIVFSGSYNASFINVVECLSNYKKRHAFIDRLDSDVRALLENDIEEIEELDKLGKDGTVIGNNDAKVEGIIDRTIHLKTSAFTKLAFSKTSDNNLDFVELLKQNKVILIKVPESQFPSKLLRNTIATFYLSKVWLAKQLLSAQDAQKKTFLLFDEFYKCYNVQLLFQDIFVEARKFDLVPVVALHYLNQLTAQCKEALKASGSSYLLLQGADVKAYYDLKSNLVQFGYEEDDLLNLERYHAIALVKTTKNYSAFITKLPKPVQVNSKNNNVIELKKVSA